MRVVVLNDGETFSDCEGCVVMDIAEDSPAMKYYEAAPDMGKCLQQMIQAKGTDEELEGCEIYLIDELCDRIN